MYTGFSYSLYDTGTEDISGKAETIFIRTEMNQVREANTVKAANAVKAVVRKLQNKPERRNGHHRMDAVKDKMPAKAGGNKFNVKTCKRVLAWNSCLQSR